jgi:2-keto-3-deoxy-L-rhamnonate aldolase RhmA
MRSTSFRQKLRNRQPMIGTFLKTPAYQIVEVLSGAGLDFVAVDSEHAPFDQSALDECVLAARAAGIPMIVRVLNRSTAGLGSLLDLGVNGLIMPHTCDPELVERILRSTRYAGDKRGYSNSARAGSYGKTGMGELISQVDGCTVSIFQIEDAAGVSNIDAIASIDNIDCLLIDRADLAVSLQTFDIEGEAVERAVDTVCASASAHGKTVGISLNDQDELTRFLKKGITFFIIGSDQSRLREDVSAEATRFRGLVGQPADSRGEGYSH